MTLPDATSCLRCSALPSSLFPRPEQCRDVLGFGIGSGLEDKPVRAKHAKPASEATEPCTPRSCKLSSLQMTTCLESQDHSGSSRRANMSKLDSQNSGCFEAPKSEARPGSLTMAFVLGTRHASTPERAPVLEARPRQMPATP